MVKPVKKRGWGPGRWFGLTVVLAVLLAIGWEAVDRGGPRVPQDWRAGLFSDPVGKSIQESWDPLFKLLTRFGFDPDGGDPPYLYQAIVLGETETALALLDMGADIDARWNIPDKPQTPIHAAAFYEETEVIRSLALLGVDINETDGLGRTPLHEWARARWWREWYPEFGLMGIALEYGGYERDGQTFKTLIGEGADLSVKDYSGDTALHIAAREGKLGYVKLLVDSGAPVNAVNEEGLTPLDEVNEVKANPAQISAEKLSQLKAGLPAEFGDLHELTKERFSDAKAVSHEEIIAQYVVVLMDITANYLSENGAQTGEQLRAREKIG